MFWDCWPTHLEIICDLCTHSLFTIVINQEKKDWDVFEQLPTDWITVSFTNAENWLTQFTNQIYSFSSTIKTRTWAKNMTLFLTFACIYRHVWFWLCIQYISSLCIERDQSAIHENTRCDNTMNVRKSIGRIAVFIITDTDSTKIHSSNRTNSTLPPHLRACSCVDMLRRGSTMLSCLHWWPFLSISICMP